MTDIVMPRLSDTMEEGTILRWLAADGQEIHRGEELVEIETDKATMVYESDQDGVLHTIAAEGDSLPVGELIARVGDDGAGGDGGSAAARTPEAAEQPATAPAAGGTDDGDGAASDAAGAAQPAVSQTPAVAQPAVAQSPAATQSPAVAPAPAVARRRGERVKASPLARRIASERGIDLQALTGSGPGGRIVKQDVETAAREPSPASSAAPAPRAQPAEEVATAKGATSEVELTRTQQTIARRMAESKATIPHFAIETDVDMQACVHLRSQLERVAGPSPRDPVPTYNDMVIKAAALALRAHPRANSSYRDGRLQLHGRVNVGIAVATEGGGEQGGTLIVPTVFDADRKALGAITREARALAARVRDGSITPPELSGGTFTVSNLGMFGVRSFTAIINPPQAAILSVGEVRAVPVVRDGGLVPRQVMSLTLACDHRILYGADAARFLARIRELLEEPAALML